MLRIEAGLLLLDADFDSSRYAWNDAHRSTPLELGWGWMFGDLKRDDRAFIGRRALERELAERTSRWAMRGLVVDWQDYDRVYDEAGLVPPKDHTPVVEDWMVYDDVHQQQVGYATSFMYSPMLQRHIAIARVRPDVAEPGTRVRLEFTVDHHYEQVAAHVARLPLYAPERKTARDDDEEEDPPRPRRDLPGRPRRAPTGPTTPSSSAAATTASSTAPISRRPACGR